MSQPNQEKPSVWDRVIKPWWAKVIIGVILLLLAWSTYVDFSKLESGERESLFVGRSTKILYNIGGKWLPTGVGIVLGLSFIGWGVFQISKEKA